MEKFDNFLNKSNDNSAYFMTPNTLNTDADKKTTALTKETQTSQKAPIAATPTKDTVDFKSQFKREKYKIGLFERIYNWSKNLTGLGTGSKKVEKTIDKYEKGQTTSEDVKNKISEYRNSNENAAQNLGDLTAAATGIAGYLALNDKAKEYIARDKIGALGAFKAIKKMSGEKFWKFKIPNIDSIIKSTGKRNAIIIPALMLLAGLTKVQVMQFNRLGSKKYKVDKEDKKTLNKKDLKLKKKQLQNEKYKEDFKNFGTGAIAGLLSPVASLVGGIVGVPLYVASLVGARYMTSKNDGKPKSTNDFVNGLKNHAVLDGLFAAAVAIPAFKHAQFSKVLSENMDKVVTKLQGKTLVQLKNSSKTTYEELQDMLLESPSIKAIYDKDNPTWGASKEELQQMITDLTDENIFAVKFLQIRRGKGLIGAQDYMAKALQENCPPTRTLDEATSYITSKLGSGYSVSKCIGVGTVAETYLAKDPSGKEVCIKVLKKGITAEKINADKQKFIDLVKSSVTDKKEQEYLLRNVEDLASGISKEVDFKNEMEAAKKLVKYTKQADVVKPIEVKDNIYVMEKAPGISLKTMADYYQLEAQAKSLKRSNYQWSEEEAANMEKQMQEIKDKSPDFADFDLSAKEIKKLLTKYIDVLNEQFTKVDKSGKTVHADIHPGNIFINLEALKSGKGKLFTLIDTGNTVDVSKEQAKLALRLTALIKNGNVKDATKVVLEGSVLPDNMTKEEAAKLVEKDLKDAFFDSSTAIQKMDIDSFFALAGSILRKHNIILGDTQLNLNKAKTSAQNSLEELIETFFNKKLGDFDRKNASRAETAAMLSSAMKDGGIISSKYISSKVWQETKNLLQMSPKEAWHMLRNPNMNKTNGEEYLTYKFKQSMFDPKADLISEFD